MPTVKCSDCNTILEDAISPTIKDDAPCPHCGSTSKQYLVRVTDEAKLWDDIGLKKRKGSTGKPYREEKVGYNKFDKTGQINWRRQIIDRDKKSYFKEVINPDTGKVIRYCNEPLTDHTNRGDAKYKPRKNR